VRTLLAETGHVETNRLFDTTKRRPFWIALLPEKPHPLVERYRQQCNLLPDLGVSNREKIEASDVVGTLTWKDVVRTLQANRHRFNPAERSICGRLIEYLEAKVEHHHNPSRYIS
jgi:hypothetical protein